MGNYFNMSAEQQQQQDDDKKPAVMGQAYYYAHGGKWDDDGCIVRAGPGLVTGGPPRKLCPETGAPLEADSSAQAAAEPSPPRTPDPADKPKILAKTITKFSWSDEGMKVSVMFELDNAVNIDQSSVTVEGDDQTYCLKFNCANGKPHIFQVKNLYKAIKFEDSKWKVSSSTKSRMKISLVKEKDIRWHNLTCQNKWETKH